MQENKITVGFIGNGKSVNRYHIPYILARPEKFIITTIFDKNLAHSPWIKINGVHYTECLDDLLQDSELDVIIVNTPLCAHYECAAKVLSAGKNCVVEKPFTYTEKEARTLFDLAESKGVLLQAYQNRRFDSDFLTTLKVIESGKLGEIFEFISCYDYYRPEMPENIQHYSADTSFLYGHCHALDQVLSYFGRPDAYHYDMRQLTGKGRMNDYFDLDLTYQNLKVSVKSSFFMVKPRPSFAVYGKKGMFVKMTEDRQEEDLKHFYMPVNQDFGIDRIKEYGTLAYYDDDHVYHEEKVISERGDYGRYYDSLYETLVQGKPQLVKPEETLLLMHVLEEATRSLTLE